MMKVFVTAGLVIAAAAISARADVGVFTGTGQNLQQITTADIQLVSIDVTIMPVRGRFLFDGTVPGLDMVEYDCTFVLRNLTDKVCEVRAGFPLDSQFAHSSEAGIVDKADWVSQYSFIAREENMTYHPKIGWWSKKDSGGPKALFNWTMNFEAKQTKELKVQYRLPMSETIATTAKQGKNRGLLDKTGNPWLDSTFLVSGLVEFAGYTTETGSSWAEHVERAEFKLITAPFERYLNHRPLFDSLPPGRSNDEFESSADRSPMRAAMLRHAWWYREISPDGWQETPDGVKWSYKDFKPKDLITIRYYLTFFPRVPEEISAWIDDLCRAETDQKMSPDDLSLIRQVILATYGQAPKNGLVRRFVENQVWYHPQKNFSLSNLTPDQRGIVTAIDRRIESMKSGK